MAETPEIQLPVTPEGNDPADYDQQTLDKLNQEIDQRHQKERAARADISPSQAKAYIELFDRLKARAATRGQDQITCRKTLAHYEKCRAVLAGSCDGDF